VAEVEAGLDALETLEPAARELALGVLQGVAELYGEGLRRIVSRLEKGEREVLEALAEDELVAHLFVLHDLHPLGLEERVQGALEETRPYLRSHGGDAELLRIEAGVVYLRLHGSCKGCPSSSLTLQGAVESAIRRVAPEVEAVVAEGAAPAPSSALVQLGGVRR
jgi:Fe-S cluster biogenesis protein NfuA